MSRPGFSICMLAIAVASVVPLPIADAAAGPSQIAAQTSPGTASPRVTTIHLAEPLGDAAWLPASAEATVTVRPRVRLSAPEIVYRGERVRLAVQVMPAHPGAMVSIEMWRGSAWTPWRDVTLSKSSRAVSLWTADRVGRQPFRVTMAADEEHAAGASGVRRVRVQKPNPYGVPVGAERIVVVDLSRYQLYFFSHGKEVRSFPCVLGRPSLPTPRGHFRIFAKRMNPGGPYGARIMSYHSPCAIHGTNQPWLLKRFPRDFSHGCTRLSNANAIWLYDHAPIGTPVWNVP
jgi:lipoprotein-anchoring transpeptidase ErfK/SrfK